MGGKEAPVLAGLLRLRLCNCKYGTLGRKKVGAKERGIWTRMGSVELDEGRRCMVPDCQMSRHQVEEVGGYTKVLGKSTSRQAIT